MTQTTAYRLAQLASTPNNPGLLPVSPATLWRWVRLGKFPKPYTMGLRTTVWDAETVDRWLTTQRDANTTV